MVDGGEKPLHTPSSSPAQEPPPGGTVDALYLCQSQQTIKDVTRVNAKGLLQDANH